MTRTRATVLVVGVTLLTSWLVAAAGTFRQSPALPPLAPPPAGSSEIDALATAVRDQAERLRTRLAEAPAPRGPVRNPFSFATRPRRGLPREVVATAAAEPPGEAPVVPARPAVSLALIGIVTDAGTRRAALSVAGDVVFVVVGDVVAGRYRVAAISPDVVELVDDRGGPVVRLGLR